MKDESFNLKVFLFLRNSWQIVDFLYTELYKIYKTLFNS